MSISSEKLISILKAKNNSLIVIDDTGSPGQNANSNFLNKDRKTFVAVYIPHKKIKKVIECLEHLTGILSERHGTNEFHFVDIYNRKNCFKHLSADEVISIFEMFSDLFEHFQLTIIVQTRDPILQQDNPNFYIQPPSVKDEAFSLLLGRITSYLKKLKPEKFRPCYIVSDIGEKNISNDLQFNKNSLYAIDKVLHFHSNDFIPIQLADFAAYFINKTMHLIDKGVKRNEVDNKLIELFSSYNFNVLNLLKSHVSSIEELDSELMNKIMEENRTNKGLKPNPYKT